MVGDAILAYLACVGLAALAWLAVQHLRKKETALWVPLRTEQERSLAARLIREMKQQGWQGTVYLCGEADEKLRQLCSGGEPEDGKAQLQLEEVSVWNSAARWKAPYSM